MKIELQLRTNARGRGGGAAFNGGGASEEDEAGAMRFGGGDGGESMTASGTRGVLVSVPVGL